jgi:ribosomal protein L11 methyltransferase
MNYIELSVSVDPKEQGSDVLIAELSEIGFDSFIETDQGFQAYLPAVQFSESETKNLLLNYSGLFKISYKITPIEQQNWNKEWESNFHPIEVDGKCCIRAPFHQQDKRFVYDILIEPKMSFGTGHHQTTQLMIRKLMKLDISSKSLLDMGSGTGVLAILASLMKSDPVTAIDIDDWSYENCIENLKKNNINNAFVYKGNAEILAGKIFHTILANINKNVLLADMTTYVQSLEKNGNLVISGFFETDMPELIQKAQFLGLSLEERAVDNQWALLHFIKNN